MIFAGVSGYFCLVLESKWSQNGSDFPREEDYQGARLPHQRFLQRRVTKLYPPPTHLQLYQGLDPMRPARIIALRVRCPKAVVGKTYARMYAS